MYSIVVAKKSFTSKNSHQLRPCVHLPMQYPTHAIGRLCEVLNIWQLRNDKPEAVSNNGMHTCNNLHQHYSGGVPIILLYACA